MRNKSKSRPDNSNVDWRNLTKDRESFRKFKFFKARFELSKLTNCILMRHRAILFGLLGLFLIYAAFRPSFQRVAFMAGFVSAASFLALAHSIGGYNSGVARVVSADWVALVCLAVGAGAAMVRPAQARD
ncbi:hypothetical protein [Pseudomonas sp. Q2-TVG4-2]|uniref:hypothetical protein n=1 Tax=Pseudomonas sp. Q2-TVG4-2 TaxID=1685699 RepID=UPI0015E79F4F|nr:hypothetical protein [Pseudomonas sp. Q2-TVG4-2]